MKNLNKKFWKMNWIYKNKIVYQKQKKKRYK